MHAKGLSRIEELLELDKWKPSRDTYILIDRIVVKDFDEDDKHRIADSVSTAFYEGEGEIFIERNESSMLHFSNRFELDGIRFEEPVPNFFLLIILLGPALYVKVFHKYLALILLWLSRIQRLSLFEGAVAPWKGEKLGQWKDAFIKAAKKFNFPVHRPVMDLTEEEYACFVEGQ